MPTRPWVMAQEWRNLLFAHWPVSSEILSRHIPPPLETDTFHGQAWLAVVPFRMKRVRLHFAPPIPGASEFPELNVRTYVVHNRKPGVWFFSLDAANFLAVAVARAWFHLPYFRARMRCQDQAGWIEYESIRTHHKAAEATLRCRYRGIGEEFQAKPGTLEHFLLERYCLYAANQRGAIFVGEIHHPAWKLKVAEAEFADQSMTGQLAGALAGNPLLHFSELQSVVAWEPKRIA
jgi:uncharacterized protein